MLEARFVSKQIYYAGVGALCGAIFFSPIAGGLAVLIALLLGSGPLSKRDGPDGKELSPKESIFLPR
jgi:hypothetical protein